MDRWQSLPIVCKGGIHQELDALTLGTQMPGAATVLQNYEPSIAGGYQRIAGYSPWDTNTVTGLANSPILGVCAALGGVFAARINSGSSSNDIYFSSGSGWTKINSSTRPGAVTKVRMVPYCMSDNAILIVDGVNPAAKWDGTTYTVINGTGAPANPAFAEAMPTYIALALSGSNQLYVSAPNSDTDFNGADNAVQFNFGDIITGIKRFRDTLYVFCQNSIWELTGTDYTTFTVDAVTRSLGCISQDTILEVGGDLIYMAPDGFRSLSATYRINDLQLGLLSRQIHPILLEEDFLSSTNANAYNAVHIAAKNQYRCFQYNSGAMQVEAFGVLGRRIDDPVNVEYEWSTLSGINPYCCHSQFVNGQEIAVFGDPSSGFVYQFENGNDFNGTPIPYVYRTPDLTFSDATLRKVMQKMTLFTQLQGVFNVSLQTQLDYQMSGSFQPPAIPISLQSGFVSYGSAIYGVDVYSVLITPSFKFPLVGAGFTIAFQFSGIDSNPPHRIDSFQVEFGEKGRR